MTGARRVFLAGLACVAPAFAATADGLSLTIYNNDLALVRDQRSMVLTGGRNRIQFPGVASEIIAESAILKGDGFVVNEQNFDFGLVTTRKLLEQAVGQEVRLVSVGAGGAETVERGTLLAVNDGLTVRVGDRIVLLPPQAGNPRIELDRLPNDVTVQPTLSIDINAKSGGARNLELQYLTRGLSWRADYVADFDDKTGRIALKGWITLTNNSGRAYENVRTRLIAGSVNRDSGPPVMAMQAPAMRFDMAEAKQASRETAGDYHLYTLPQATTILNGQVKQVAFMTADVKASRRYVYETAGFSTNRQAQQVTAELSFSNSRADGLGEPLPSGVIRVYGADGKGESLFIGADDIGHTPAGEPVHLRLGKAFDVTVQSTFLGRREYAKDRYENSVRYVFRNNRAEAATVTLRQLGLGTNWEITEASAPHRQGDATTAEWDVRVPPRGETSLSFTVRQKE